MNPSLCRKPLLLLNALSLQLFYHIRNIKVVLDYGMCRILGINLSIILEINKRISLSSRIRENIDKYLCELGMQELSYLIVLKLFRNARSRNNTPGWSEYRRYPCLYSRCYGRKSVLLSTRL